nr:T9SS type A sorting domain-containing protein [uncultured Psychroserpens sp.]
MKKILLSFFFLAAISNSQTFTLDVNNPFFSAANGSVQFADVDGDLDNDVFITGSDNNSGSSIPFSKLYINDGIGGFTESTTTFVDVDNSSTDFGDIDGDTDLDLIISGRKNDGTSTTLIYINDGNGNFSEVPGVDLFTTSADVKLKDIDGDLDLDLLAIGNSLTILYLNDGNGTFTVTSNNFDGIGFGDFEFFDADGDFDSDLLIIGDLTSGGGNASATLYLNDGFGNFSEVSGPPFLGLYYSSVSTGDIDGDSDLDIVITGQPSPGQGTTLLYINDGSGNFTELNNITIENITIGEGVFADLNDDNSIDLLLTGQLLDGSIATKLYINDGSGNFNESTTALFEGLTFLSRIAVADIDGDNDNDIINIGLNSDFESTTNLYTNNLYTLNVEDDVLQQFKIYPNPSKTIINIENIGGDTIKEISIFDVGGRLVLSETSINTNIYTIDLKDLANGSYFVEVKTTIASFNKKILKN